MNVLAVVVADLLADAGDWVQIIVFLVIGALSLIAGLINRVKEVKQDAARRARQPPPRPAPKPHDPLADEIEEFLRRAAQRQRPAEAARPSPAEPVPPGPPPSAQPRPPLRPSRPQVASSPVLAEPVAEPVKAESVAEYVRERFKREQFGKVGSTGLGEQVALADDKLEAHIHETFDHQLSRLGSVAGESGPSKPASALPSSESPPGRPPGPALVDLAALMAHPHTMRQAILLSEILNRPEHRWQ